MTNTNKAPRITPANQILAIALDQINSYLKYCNEAIELGKAHGGSLSNMEDYIKAYNAMCPLSSEYVQVESFKCDITGLIMVSPIH